jgi:type II secretory ATPase GspE/PulE/Tfp pilus assembly ATPase PilB-like protein
LDSGSEGNQSEDNDPSVDNILSPPRIDGIPEGGPLVIEVRLSNIYKEMSESHYSEVNQDDATLISKMLDDLKEEATANRKRDLHVNPEDEVTKSTKDLFRKTEYSHTQKKLIKRIDSGV